MLTDTEKMLMDCLMKHKVQEEAIKIIIMILLENTQGQNLLINFQVIFLQRLFTPVNVNFRVSDLDRLARKADHTLDVVGMLDLVGFEEGLSFLGSLQFGDQRFVDRVFEDSDITAFRIGKIVGQTKPEQPVAGHDGVFH